MFPSLTSSCPAPVRAPETGSNGKVADLTILWPTVLRPAAELVNVLRQRLHSGFWCHRVAPQLTGEGRGTLEGCGRFSARLFCARSTSPEVFALGQRSAYSARWRRGWGWPSSVQWTEGNATGSRRIPIGDGLGGHRSPALAAWLGHATAFVPVVVLLVILAIDVWVYADA